MRVNVYIRKENEEHWDKIPNKSNWVNERLEVSTAPSQKPIGKLCKIHGLPLDSRDRCLQKGCKYA